MLASPGLTAVHLSTDGLLNKHRQHSILRPPGEDGAGRGGPCHRRKSPLFDILFSDFRSSRVFMLTR